MAKEAKTPVTEASVTETPVIDNPNMFSIAKLREMNSVATKLLSECTIGKNINEKALDFFLDLSEELETLLKRIDKKIKKFNEDLKKTNEQFALKHDNGADIQTEKGVKTPEPGVHPEYDKQIGILNKLLEKIMEEEVEFTTKLSLRISDFPTDVNALYRKVFRKYLVKEQTKE